MSPLPKRARKRLREPFGKAALTVAVLALVFAMLGGAYAASKLNGTQKKEVEKIAKRFQGAGPAGANGTNGTDGKDGAAGTNGADGNSVTGTTIATGGACGVPTGVKYTLNAVSTNICNGTNGTNGADGKSVEAEPAGAECPEGGTKFKIGGVTKGKACNGEEGEKGEKGDPGEPWTPNGALPSNATEKGTWAVTAKSVELFGLVDWAFTSFAFPIPLSAGLEESHTHIVSFEEVENETVPAACDNGATPKPSVENPEADPGQLCVFVRFIEGPEETEITTPNLEQGVGPTGGLIKFSTSSPGVDVIGIGSYAVTAP